MAALCQLLPYKSCGKWDYESLTKPMAQSVLRQF